MDMVHHTKYHLALLSYQAASPNPELVYKRI
jgi:hypothetical protein